MRGNFEHRVLAAHNRERHAMGIEPLKWNPALAASARQWANHLASTGQFKHAPERIPDPQGENLWAGTKGYFSLEAMVDGWVREKRHFRPGTFPNNSTTGRVEDVGHYTQLIWRRTRQVGCATARGHEEDVLVCRYSEAGNYLGETPF
ncbi:CAP domain-containing protein [Novosphingobium sp. RD2P27]|uniref:CAP domain-containing protein n=1 Tax=Novosphingobium kalidii TaxID=3230299 RepID=A0ABV2D154_9SPHN